MIDQVEFADVILISKTDLMTADALNLLKGYLRTLNPRARIEAIAHGQVDLAAILDTGRFSLEQAALAPGWLRELRGEHTPETETYGIGSVVYRAREPFHPVRLHRLFEAEWTHGVLLRAKGYFWNAARFTEIGSLAQAGHRIRHGYVGRWWKFLPDAVWPEDDERLSAILAHWDDAVGDCRQELVFIGQGIDRQALWQALDDCLLTDEEIDGGPDLWGTYPDPLGDGETKAVTSRTTQG